MKIAKRKKLKIKYVNNISVQKKINNLKLNNNFGG